MTSLEGVIAKAAPMVVPSPDDAKRIKKIADGLMAATRAAVSVHPEASGAVLGGSYAKGTWLPKDVDIDIFVRFRKDTAEDVFERVGLQIGKEATAGQPRGKKYAQHPYTEATVDGVRVNIVPCYDVEKGEWKSAADRSPFHVLLVEELRQEKKDQVRLLKRFMRAVGVYGAEIENQGFSGYVAEVLTMEHDGFEGALRFFAGIKPRVEGFTLSLPDPVDPRRDLGRAVSAEKLGRMVLAARAFIEKPSLSYFREVRGKARPDLRGEVVALTFSHRRLSEDTLWGELKRTLHHLEARAEASGFKMARTIAASDNDRSSAFLFLPEFALLPRLEQRVGPSVDRVKETQRFFATNRAKAKLAWVGADGRARILQKRPQTEFGSFLREAVSSRMRGLGASLEMERGVSRSGRVLTGGALARAARSRAWLRDGVTEIVSDTVGTG